MAVMPLVWPLLSGTGLVYDQQEPSLSELEPISVKLYRSYFI